MNLADLDPVGLAERFGTPFYVYDLDVIERRVAGLRAALPPVFDIAFALKANPALAVVAHLAGLGIGADVASGGELETAVRAGIDPERIVFTGPGKLDTELRRAVELGIHAVTVESLGELERLERIADGLGRRARILLRAAVGSEGERADGSERVRIIGDGGAGKFGMDPGDLADAAHRAGHSASIELLGLHAFGASNVLDAGAILDHVRATVAAAREMAQVAGVGLRLVDVGGGLGIPYGSCDTALDLVELGAGLRAFAAAWADDAVLRSTRVLLEPGRFLTGPAGVFVARVVDRKSVAGSEVAVLDGGINHVLRPALVRQEHRLRILDRAGQPREVDHDGPPVSIVGPLCTGLDVFAAAARLPVPEPGDLVAILDVGAYGFTESMPLFLSHPTPAEVAVRAGRAALIRPRIAPETWLAGQLIPVW
jgi:diaminopimelate decarboxylase